MQQCLHSQFGYSLNSSQDMHYVMSWEFFYANTPSVDRASRCLGYVTAELCFNQTQCSAAADQTDILRLKELYKSGYQHYCYSSEDPCADFSTTSTSTTTPEPTTAQAAAVTPTQGSCELCDVTALQSVTLSNSYLGFNRTWFGQSTCKNYTEAFDCYTNCSIDGIYENLVTKVTFNNKTAGHEILGQQRYEMMSLLRTQLIISCNPTCRHADLWVCENYNTGDDLCDPEAYNSWLSCYEAGVEEQQNCNKACNVAQRRVNSFKAIREIGCAIQSVGDLCGQAVIRCTHEMYSYNFNLERFLTADLTTNQSCEYFMLGTKCLLGDLLAFGPADSPLSINSICTTDNEKETVQTLAATWRNLYHHDECESLASGLSYQDICNMEANATALNNNSSSGLNTTTDAVVEEIDRELEGVDGENDNDACPDLLGAGSPCPDYPLEGECGDKFNSWVKCLAMNEVFTNCEGLCTTKRRKAFADFTYKYMDCTFNKSAANNNFCWQHIEENCLLVNGASGLASIASADDLGTVAGLCGNISQFSYCVASSVNETKTVSGTPISSPCANQISAVTSTVEIVANALSNGMCDDTSLYFVEACSTSAQNQTSQPTSECVFTFTSSEMAVCDRTHNIEDCDIAFPAWKSCVETAAGPCDGVCTQASRDMFIRTLRGELKCSLNSTTICSHFATTCVDNAMINFVTLPESTEAQHVCQALVDLRGCFNSSATGTLSNGQSTVEQVCSSELQTIQLYMDKVSTYHSQVGCDTETSNTWTQLCPGGHVNHEAVLPGPVVPGDTEREDEDDIGLQPASALYDLEGVAASCPTCQTLYTDINNITCLELSALMDCLNEYTTNCASADHQDQLVKNAHAQRLFKKVCDPVCPMIESKQCMDVFVDEEGFIPCSDLSDYRKCVVDAMSSYEGCTEQGLCSEGPAYYHAEVHYLHSLRCDIQDSDDSCLEAVDDACWSPTIRENLMNMNAFMTLETFCGMLDTFEDCTTRAVLSDVTLMDGDSAYTPCQGQSESVSTFTQRILTSYNRTVCSRPADHIWGGVCNTMIPQYPDEEAIQHQVSVEMSLDADYTTVVGENSDGVIEQLKAQLASLLGVPVEKLQNMKITPGSIKIEFDLITTDSGEVNSTQTALNNPLPPLVINGQAYDSQVTSILTVSQTPISTTASSTTNSTTSTSDTTTTTTAVPKSSDPTEASTVDDEDSTITPHVSTSSSIEDDATNNIGEETYVTDNVKTTEKPESDNSGSKPAKDASVDSSATMVYSSMSTSVTITLLPVIHLFCDILI